MSQSHLALIDGMEEDTMEYRTLSFDIFGKERKHFYNGENFCLMYVLSGVVKAEYGRQEYQFTAGALLATNPLEWYFCDAKEGEFLTLTMPLGYLQKAGVEISRKIFCIVPDDSPGTKREYHEIRRALANLWQLCFGESPQFETVLMQNTLKLFMLLRDHFSSDLEDDIFGFSADGAAHHLNRAVSYIHSHWTEAISVKDIADFAHISPNYLSRLWREYMDCTVLEYISDVRLDDAEKQLHGTHSITEIASFCGFKNTNALNQRFIQCFGVSPKRYRDLLRSKTDRILLSMKNDSPDLTSLLSYADCQEHNGRQEAEHIKLDLDGDSTGIPLRHTWRKLVNIGYARDGLVEIVQQQLTRAQQEIGFEYVRFHGIFDDDMHIFYEDQNGEVQPNYILSDMLFDFLLSIGLKPFIELSYVPRTLASRPVRVLERETYFSKVNDRKKWEMLIQLFLCHVIERYGRQSVLQWRFAVGSSELKLQGYMTEDEFLKHYVSSFRAVKGVCPALRLGGFSGHSSLIRETDEFEKFVEFGIQNDCIPDFFCIQNFPVEYVKKSNPENPILLQKLSPVTISADVHYSTHLLEKTEKILKKHHLEDREIWFEEWNASIWQRDVVNDTCYKAAWLVKDICENYDRAEAFGYWLLTDFIEERLPHGAVPYYGGNSLITYNGIPKAGWNAMRLLRKLGDTCLASGDGYFITRREHSIQILLYQYVHYGDMYRFCNQTPISADRAYDIFLSRREREYEITIHRKTNISCRIKNYTVNRDKGSSFDQWLAMGKPQNMDSEEIEYLKSISGCGLTVREWTVQSNVKIQTTLPAHNIELYDLIFNG